MGRSGIAMAACLAPASSVVLVLVLVLVLGAVALLTGADSAGLLPPPSCLLSQAAEASKIRDATQASERMRGD